MKLEITLNDQEIVVTTEHSASSYGQPIVLIDGELIDAKIVYESDNHAPSLLDLFADANGIHNGPQTREALRQVHDEVLEDYNRRAGWDDNTARGGFYDAVIAEFNRRGKALREKE